VLRGIFGPKREVVSGGWRGLNNEELHNLYVSPNISEVREGEIGEECSIHGGEKCIQILIRKLEGKRPLRSPECRWNYIRMDLREIGWEVIYWIHLAEDND